MRLNGAEVAAGVSEDPLKIIVIARQSADSDPVFVAQTTTPSKERKGIGTDRKPKARVGAFDHIADGLRHQGWRGFRFSRVLEKGLDAAAVRVIRNLLELRKIGRRHSGVDNAGLD